MIAGANDNPQVRNRIRVGYVENVAILACQRTSCHGKGRSTAVGIAGHRLINHDAVIECGVAVALGIVCC